MYEKERHTPLRSGRHIDDLTHLSVAAAKTLSRTAAARRFRKKLLLKAAQPQAGFHAHLPLQPFAKGPAEGEGFDSLPLFYVKFQQPGHALLVAGIELKQRGEYPAALTLCPLASERGEPRPQEAGDLVSDPLARTGEPLAEIGRIHRLKTEKRLLEYHGRYLGGEVESAQVGLEIRKVEISALGGKIMGQRLP